MTPTQHVDYSEVSHLIDPPAPPPRSANTHVWFITCPACGDDEAVAVRSDGLVKFTCPDPECSQEQIAESLGVTADELAGLVDDIVLTPGAAPAVGPIDWSDVTAEEDLDRARLVRRHAEETGHDIAFTPDGPGFMLRSGAAWSVVSPNRIRAFAHEAADLLYEAAEGAFSSARVLHNDKDTDAARGREATALRLSKMSRALRRTSYLDSLMRELCALPGVETSITEFDHDPDVLGVRNGVVNLRTGELRPYTHEDRITRVVNIDFDPDAPAPLWEKYLSEVFLAEDGAADPEFVRFMQTLVGYAATGHTREHILPVLYGGGQNGKSLFLETLTHVFADYTSTTPFETFEDRASGGIPNDLAALRGARLVIASEGGAGRLMNEGLIKRVTGGDTISARFMRAEWFSFTPAFLIFLATNHKPTLRGQDEGLWRRIKLIPFRAQFPVTMPETPSPFVRQRDNSLGDTIRDTEAAGILAWAVRGAVRWYAEGLQIPAAIATETSAYRTESDRIGEFISDTLEVTGEHLDVVFLTDVYTAYYQWARDAHEERPFGRRAFGEMLGERPQITRGTRGGKAMFRGIKLLTVAEQTARMRAAERAERALAPVASAPF